MSFIVKDKDVLDKYNEIWGKTKSNLNINFHIMPVYDKTYIKAKVREFNGVIKTNFGCVQYQKKICVTLALLVLLLILL